MLMTNDPVRDAETYYEEQERGYEAYLEGNADCNICMEPIRGEHCYIMDPTAPMESCFCESCMARQKKLMKDSGIDAILMEYFDNYLYEALGRTPHDENKEEVA